MTRWYLRDAAGRYYDGCGWAADRSARHVYAHRWLAVLVWQAVGGYIYYE